MLRNSGVHRDPLKYGMRLYLNETLGYDWVLRTRVPVDSINSNGNLSIRLDLS